MCISTSYSISWQRRKKRRRREEESVKIKWHSSSYVSEKKRNGVAAKYLSLASNHRISYNWKKRNWKAWEEKRIVWHLNKCNKYNINLVYRRENLTMKTISRKEEWEEEEKAKGRGHINRKRHIQASAAPEKCNNNMYQCGEDENHLGRKI